MMTRDTIYFSGRRTLIQMENASYEQWFEEWKNRIGEYYFTPVDILNRKNFGFSAMAILCSSVEAIGTVMFPNVSGTSDRFIKTSEALFSRAISDPKLLYKHYRCGLIHNGRTNQSGTLWRLKEISAINYGINDEFEVHTNSGRVSLIIANPTKILKKIAFGFESWSRNVSATSIGRIIKDDFARDIQLSKQI